MIAAAAVLFSFQDARISESSSLVATPSGDWLWTANDSGDSARVFAVDGQGRTLAVADLPGTRVVDVEDAAYGPDRTLYLADIGDNDAQRASVTVLRVPEPAVDPTHTGVRLSTQPPTRTVLTYPDGAHDAETVLVQPVTGQLLVVTKSVLGSAVYEAPSPLADGVLRKVGTVPIRITGTPGGPSPHLAAQLLATGGSVSPDGSRLVVRTYTDAYVYEVPGDDLAAAFDGRPEVVPLPATDQGEGITWSRDGSTLLTSSEGRGAPVWSVPAPAPPAPSATPSPAGSRSPGPAPTADASPATDDGGPDVVLAVALATLVVLTIALLVRRRHR